MATMITIPNIPKHYREGRFYRTSSGEQQVMWRYTLSGVEVLLDEMDGSDLQRIEEHVFDDGSTEDRVGLRYMVMGFIHSYREFN